MAMASQPPTPSVLPNKGGLISTLNPNDVLSGRGKHVNSHPGNIRFLTRIVPEYLEEYCHPTTTRTEKVHVAARLVNEIRLRSNPPGRFLTGCKDNPGYYVEIGDELAWKKVAKALRDASKRNMTVDSDDTTNGASAKCSQEKVLSQYKEIKKKRRGSCNDTSTSHQQQQQQQHQHQHQQHWQQPASDRRLVIVRPSMNTSDDDDDNIASSHEHEQWPLFHRLCCAYGFTVDVKQLLEPCKDEEVAEKSPCDDDEVGPHFSNLLVDNNSSSAMGNLDANCTAGIERNDRDLIRLRKIGERLSIRLLRNKNTTRKSNSSSKGSKRKTISNATLGAPIQHPPNLNDGDIIQTLDGKPHPTFAMLYGMMCRNEKLVLEVIDGKASSSTGGARVERKGDLVHNIDASSTTVASAVRKARKESDTEVDHDAIAKSTATSSLNADDSSRRRAARGGHNIDAGSTVTPAVRKARSDIVTETDHAIAARTTTNALNADNIRPGKADRAGGTRKEAGGEPNFDASSNVTPGIRKARKDSNDHAIAESTASNALHADDAWRRKADRGGHNFDTSSTVTPAVRKARRDAVTETDHAIAERTTTNTLNADDVRPGKADRAGGTRKGEGGGHNIDASSTVPHAVRKPRKDTVDENDHDAITESTTTNALNAGDANLGNADRAGSTRRGEGGNVYTTVALSGRKARGQSVSSEVEHAIVDTGATTDILGPDNSAPRNNSRPGGSKKGNGRTDTGSSIAGMNQILRVDVKLPAWGQQDAALAECTFPGISRSESDLSELEILPKETRGTPLRNEPTASTPMPIATLASRWEPPQRGCGNTPLRMERRRNSDVLSPITSDRVYHRGVYYSAPTNYVQSHPEASQMNSNNDRQRDKDMTGIEITRNGNSSRERSCTMASYDGGIMEDELFNMVEAKLSREQQQRKPLSDDDRIPTSSMREEDHVGNSPVFPSPPLDISTRTTEHGSKLTSKGSYRASDIATTSTVGANEQPLPHDKVVSVSSSSPPTIFDCTGDDGNSVSSSSSSSSCPSSSSAMSTSSSSSSSSSSDSSSGNTRNEENNSQPTTPTSQLGAVNNTTTIDPVNHVTNNAHAPSKSSRKRPPAAITTIGSSTTLPVRSSTSSLQNGGVEAPTSLSRLWPDPSDIIKALTRWAPPVAEVRRNSRHLKQTVDFFGPIRCNDYYPSKNEQPRYNPLLQSSYLSRNGDIPREFKNADEVIDVMASTLLNEGLFQINNDYHAEKYSNGRWNRCPYRMRLTKLTEVSPIFQSKSSFDESIKLYEAQFSAHGENNLPPSNLSELYCMHFSAWEGCKFGIVAHDFPTTFTFRTYTEGKSLLKLWLVVHQNERQIKESGWLSREDFRQLLDPFHNDLTVKPNTMFTLISCGSTTNVVRQFEAIKCLPYLKPHLQRALFSSYNTSIPTSTTTTKPRSLPIDVWNRLKSSHNSYQLSAISKILTGSCRENVCLVQGPPGTGKSSTIVGLVSALLSGKAPLPQQRQSGCLIHPGKTMGLTFAEPQARNRILICAATNQAVDSLAWKIKQGSLGPSGKVGDFALARFGSLPWESSRNLTDQKPEILSSMEDFLYEINVDRRAGDGMQDFEYYEEEQEQVMSWSPEKMKPQRKKRRKIVGRAKVRSQVLASCSVVITTLSGAGSKAFIDAVCRDPTRNDSEFDAVIIDEACQASEPESLIPFKFNPTTITLVGDPQQLPVLTLSGSSTDNKLYERSLFERLQSLNFPTILLRNQYRMHEDIAAFPSQQFYQGKLITPNSIKDRPAPPWSTCPCFPPVCFWDTNGHNVPDSGCGFRNNQEVEFITKSILSTFAQTFLNRSDEVVSIGIISFYRDQVKLLSEQVAKIPALKNSMMNIKVATVDGFQGSECDIVILSCVRSHSHAMRDGARRNAVGFLNDYRRLNVALTRAKYSLWIVGNAEVLNSSDLWRKLLQEMNRRRVLRHEVEFRDIFARWKSANAF